MGSAFSDRIKRIDFEPTVLVERISQILTDAILEGTLRGGDQLIETDLKEQFGISRSPLREAFRILEKMALVEIVPRKGTFVRSIARRDIEEHFPVRSVLEGLAAREAYGRIGKEGLRQMARALEKMRNAVARNDTKAYWEHHFVFHEVFIHASGNLLLIDSLKTLRMHTMWYRFSYKYYEENLSESLSIHEEILKLLRAKKKADTGHLEEVVRNHIEVAMESFLVYLDEQKKVVGKG
jgi:DNA-binding GntR family transcriptional regulator